MTDSSRRRSARGLSALVALALLSTGIWLTAAGPTFACSCAMQESLADYAPPEYAIFTGAAGPLDARGVPVRVIRWFSGEGAAPVVYLAKNSFGDGASCGISTPVVGSEWIWVTYVPEDGGDLSAGLCSPHAGLNSPEGNAMVAQAAAAFGGFAPPGTETDPPETAPAPVPPNVAADLGGAIVVGTVALGVVVLLGAILIARRRPADR